MSNAYVYLRFVDACRRAGIASDDTDTVSAIKSNQKGRDGRYTALRGEVAWRMRQPDSTNRYCSFLDIAAAFGRRSHSGFIYAVRRHEERKSP